VSPQNSESNAFSDGFTPGLTLSRRFFEDAVQPILARSFQRLQYAAALIGPGSEVLGFDTPISTDHHWGPRVMLFLAEEDFNALGKEIDERLGDDLPHTFLGYPTNFGPPDEIGVQLLRPIDSGPVAHRVELTTVPRWFTSYLGWNTQAEPTIVEWLTFPQHRLRAATTGAVFRDDRGALTAARATLAWYPHDLWLYLLTAQWNRIAEEEAFMARCGDVGDELGSTLVAARIVRDLMHLCFLVERQYAPYAKWFGSAFRRLDCGSVLEPMFLTAIRAGDWLERQQALVAAYEHVASMHNALSITEPIDIHGRPYHGRPYLVITAERFASAIQARIGDPAILELPRFLGSLNQLVDATDKLESADERDRIGRIYVQGGLHRTGWQQV
jgi:hypothetical protein